MIRLLAAAGSGFLAFALGIVASRYADEPLPIILATILLAFVGAPAFVLWIWRVPGARDDSERSGRLQTIDLDVFSACQIAETEDEGLHFFLETVDGETIFLSGQYLYEPVSERRFPARRVRILVDSKGREVVDIECSGGAIAVPPALSEFTESEHERDRVPRNLQRFQMGIVDVLKGLGRA